MKKTMKEMELEIDARCQKIELELMENLESNKIDENQFNSIMKFLECCSYVEIIFLKEKRILNLDYFEEKYYNLT